MNYWLKNNKNNIDYITFIAEKVSWHTQVALRILKSFPITESSIFSKS